MHVMICNVFHLDRTKRAQTNVQRYKADSNAFVAKRRQQFRRKVQPGCRRCGRTVVFRIYCLVTVFIRKLFRDIRRKRHLSQFIQDFKNMARIRELNQAVSAFEHVQNLTAESALTNGYHRARPQFFAGADQRFPHVAPAVFQQQDFNRRAGILLYAEQAGRNYLGIVQNQAVARLQICPDFMKTGINNPAVVHMIY